MGERGNRVIRNFGLNTWRAGCGESRTSGSEGGPEKPTCRNGWQGAPARPYTYVPTKEGWLYLASIIDVFSRTIVGWAMDDNMRKELAIAALTMATTTRRPGANLIHHSDRGSQYASKAYRDALNDLEIACSMSGVGNCYDNAMKESFFHTLKIEGVPDSGFETRSEAKSAIFEYIEGFYNRRRLHSSLGYRTPLEVEQGAA